MKFLFLSLNVPIALLLMVAPAVAIPETAAERFNIQLDKPVVEIPTEIPTQEPKIIVIELLVKGVTGELEDEIYRVIETRPGRSITRSELQQDIDRIIKTGRFAKVQAIPEETTLGTRVTFIAEPNPTLKKVALTGRQVIPEAVVEEAFRSQYGQPLDRKVFQIGIQTLNKWYKDNDYMLAQVVDTTNITSDGVATLEVAEGEVEEIQIKFTNVDGEEKDKNGNPIKGYTRSFIVTREMETRVGSIVNRNRIQADLQRIAGLQIFKDLKVDFAPGIGPRKVIVVLKPVEGLNITTAPGVNWSSRTGISAIGSLQAGNFGGNNQKLSTQIELGDRNLSYDLSFSDPWIAGDRYRTSYTARLSRQQSTSLNFDGGKTDVKLANGDRPRLVRTGGAITFNRPLSPDVFNRSDWVASLGLQYQRITIQDASRSIVAKDAIGNNLSASGTGQDELLSIPITLTYDKRNDLLTPTQGSVLRLSSEQSIPIGQSSIFSNNLRASYSTYLPTKLVTLTPGCRKKEASAIDCPQTFAFNLTGGTILGTLPPYSASSLGGTNSVRGYEDGDVASARSFVQASAEYRFPIFSLINGALFLDGATDFGSGRSVIGNPGGARSKPGSGLGYGLGVRIKSPLGPIRLDYGWNDRGENKLHFGLGERF